MSFKRVFFYSKSHTPFKEIGVVVKPHAAPTNDYGIQLNCSTPSGIVLQNECRFYKGFTYWVYENMPPRVKGFMNVVPMDGDRLADQELTIGTWVNGTLYASHSMFGPLRVFGGPEVQEPLIIGSLNIVAPDITEETVTFNVADFDVEIFLNRITDIVWQGWNPGSFGPDPIPAIDSFTQEQTPWTDESATNLVFDVITEETGGNALKLRGRLI